MTEQQIAYSVAVFEQTRLFHKSFELRRKFNEEDDKINSELTSLWNEYHKKWMTKG